MPSVCSGTDDLSDSLQDALGEDAVRSDGHGPQPGEVTGLGLADPAQQFRQVFAQERFPAGDVQALADP